MPQVQQLLPDNYKPVDPLLPPGFMEYAAILKGVDRDWVRVPDTALFIKVAVMINGATIEIKKQGKLALINLCCFDPEYQPGLLKVVKRLYKENKLGKPQQPQMPAWVHTVPVKGIPLTEEELMLSCRLVIAFYWVIYAQEMKRIRAGMN